MIFNMTDPIISRLPEFTYTGTSTLIDNGKGNWRIKFLTSGVFTPVKDMLVDVFLVGGGAGGSYSAFPNETPGGGAGYTTTTTSVRLTAGTAYDIVVGAGGAKAAAGGKSSAFGSEAARGNAGSGSSSSAKGGNGGSGGGGRNGGEGGVDGADGGGTNGGTGQGMTTREFGESTGALYATGGGSSKSTTVGQSGDANTGDGGSGYQGGSAAGTGGSGIVIIRKHKEATA